ncbi:FAD-binding oxidoreductase [Flavobacteriales bacterium]|nr:FAD-binding oxidoreductase [Flavobacteriales bacterium]
MFHSLKVIDIKNETSDTVSVAFEIPEGGKSTFDYTSGQYLTLKFNINGNEERRSYSMCSSPFSGEPIRIAVKRVDKGLVSNHINDVIKIGDQIEVMSPQGNFTLETSLEQKTYVAFAAGSGITPIWSMIKSVLDNEPGSKFVLFYGNKTSDSTIFKNEIDSLTGDRLSVYHILSREETGNSITNGRIDKNKATELLKSNLDLLKSKAFFMCGPEEMIFNVKDVLQNLGVSEDKIKFELFTTPVLLAAEKEVEVSNFTGTAKVKVIYDEEEITFDLSSDGENVLEAAMKHDVDAPFSCKGAVCCTCKAKVTEGKMIMDANYALSDEEVAEGFVLACQAHPASENVVLDFDEA